MNFSLPKNNGNVKTNHGASLLVVTIFLLAFASQLQAQNFSGGLYGGFTTSQIDGDERAGFHCIGPAAGIFVTYPCSFVNHSFELGFAQKGAADSVKNYKIALGYVDATYLLQIKPHSFFASFPEIVKLDAGAMLSAKVYETFDFDGVSNQTDDFSRLDMQACGGVSVDLGKRLDFAARCSYSLIPIEQRYHNLALYFLLRWNFFTPKEY